MYTLNKILVCLDFTRMDEYLIKYAVLVASTMKSEVYFFYVNDQSDLPLSVSEKYPELSGPLDENLTDRMEKTVAQYFPAYKEYSVQFISREGSPSQKILEWSDIEQMDLIIMGKKSELKGNGVNPKKIANLSHCSILFVPEGSRMSLGNLFVPIDFSLRSKTGIDQALALNENVEAKITLQHVFFVPHGYHYTGKTYEEFAIIMRENARKDYEKFMRMNNYDPKEFQDIYTFDDDDAPADKIYLEALNHDADLIILPSRGRTRAASLLLGSVALDLLKYPQRIPYMIVKDKSENMSFFQALMKV